MCECCGMGRSPRRTTRETKSGKTQADAEIAASSAAPESFVFHSLGSLQTAWTSFEDTAEEHFTPRRG